ncbi:uncharacterized protein LOC106160413 [Lingula anatina]|uniref:Uncharacterized protein LOC106160413 n=1 Tax=Lingula anatina TaxID=7574 RepID=A0A1S3I2H2_LINAN|nr:uncharacterized protein LOC106160413 [Lingula anatina]XP_013392475.1 uncharacterized protein LOC106160413 [Lingula anatina]|eukprot:XP_013392465.1 uncharacterized protein LOC106160413 [Lingula anatina]
MVAKHFVQDAGQASSDALRITSESCSSSRRLRLRRWAPNIVLSVLVLVALATVLVLVGVLLTRQSDQGSVAPSSLSKGERTGDGFPCEMKNGFYPSSSDCQKYYHCVNGTAHMFSCGENRMWSQADSACVAYVAAACAPSTVGTSKAPIITRSTSSLRSKFTKTSGGSSECGTPNGFFANPRDCTSFYTCLEGRVQATGTCSSGRMWSQRHLRCVDLDLRLCFTDNQAPAEGNTTPPPVNMDKKVTGDPSYMCERAPVLVPVDNDCRKYVVCLEVGTHGRHFQCPQGTVWRQSERACASETTESAIFCERHSNITQPVSSESTATSIPSSDSHKQKTKLVTTVAPPVSPSRVLRLPSKARASTTDQSTVTLHSRIQTKPKMKKGERTMTNENALNKTANVTNSPETLCKENGFWAHPTDCRKFLMCIHDAVWGTVLTCPNHTMWSQDSRACVEYNIDGCHRNLVALRTTPSTVQFTNPPFVCPSTGKFPALDSCRKYVICYGAGLQGYYVNCPSGLVWNDEKDMCYPYDPSFCG